MTRATFLIALLSPPAWAQSVAVPLAFDVASVKLNSDPISHSSLTLGKGTMTIIDVDLRTIIRIAYDIRSFQFVGPDWLSSIRLNIVAKFPADTTQQQRLEMMRTLLAERFKLSIHRESKEMRGYAIVVAKTGPNLKSSKETTMSWAAGRTILNGQMLSMADVSVALSSGLLLPFVDRTGLTGLYDIKLKWSPDLDPSESADQNQPGDGLSLFGALQSLGLKLEAQKVPVEIIVVDHSERAPIEN